ncbi:hypothetical protein DSS3P8_228 [Roseobacter phage DSS3P8]|nr:hypothetical protein DSS3P8_228 [Roseobacter phage DSS3P8]
MTTATAFDHAAATAEGWGLFETMGTDDSGSLRIERIDFPEGPQFDGPVFEGDAEAWQHVMARAMAGSALHRDAIARVADDNPSELDFAREISPALMRLLGY